ncbi:Estradiol 17-beta-dehydrogenase [Tritrichomonas foetus]|uniref:Estradiol 17-beta-dehydrogenase n=1 Tax=Tritrichomonas foetus TaxID=1144522 RepID=A0A1J4KST2_9EUKA|nr:Estradiol 17-beta-dehydrogenase [Tritrichomonas foetus]|eukprot:OHT13944.1 Estradiol 17-beta-dehydrogenase [Tritrichomonas foetus]
MKTIVITGSSSGIGKASAKLFATKGWTVIATMRTPENEKELTKYPNIHIYPLDISNAEQVKEISAQILSKFDVDVLFNNAGYGMKCCFEDMKDDEMMQSINTNIVGMVHVTQQFIPHFKKRKNGLILTTTSLAGEIGLLYDGIYAADKWAVTGISEMLYYELAPYNIQVKILVPGVVKTSFKMVGNPAMSEEQQEFVDRQLKFFIPDFNQIEEMTEAAEDAYFAVADQDQDRFTYVTGAVAKQIIKKRQELGNEEFRKYYKNYILGKYDSEVNQTGSNDNWSNIYKK